MNTKNTQKERWLPVVGFDGYYDVSNCGRVRSLKRTVPSKNGSTQIKKAHLMKLLVREDGYIRIYLNSNGMKKNATVHNLVIATFIGPCPEGNEIGHLDGNRGNNNLENLRYMSRSCNLAFRVEHGTDPTGSRNPNAKLTEHDIRFIKTMIRDGFLISHIAKIFKVTAMNIGHIKKGKLWKHIQI